jgi:GNAT superfamily N-acetyltransferase
MSIEVIAESIAALKEYALVPIAFRVERQYRVECLRQGLGGLALIEEEVVPYIKDYDALSGGPLAWQQRWDMSQWGILAAYEGERRVGGAVIAWKTNDLVISGNPEESAVLWDLRVDSGFRHIGVGSRLLACAINWARARFCCRLEIETQNTNVPACKFYARHGCDLVAIDRSAYGNVCNEVRLLWEKVL